jgi:hypothetical protein
VLGQCLLIEFRRPAHTITRTDVAQAEDYRQAISPYLRNSAMSIIVIGGKSSVSAEYSLAEKVRVLTFNDVISAATTSLNWLLSELTQPIKQLH